MSTIHSYYLFLISCLIVLVIFFWWRFRNEKKRNEELLPFFKSLSDKVKCDVTEIKRLENSRSDFVANVSHELKTPLTNIIGYAETLETGALSDMEAAPRFLEKITQNAKRLRYLVDDILELSAIESGRTKPNRVKLHLDHFIDSLLPNFISQAEAKNIRLVQNIPSGLPVLLADEEALRKILSNLLDNAIKYTPDGGEVTIQAFVTNSHLQIGIKDNGIGIDRENLERVFERFYRVDPARSRSIGGTGLGLAIVKHLVYAHNGKVWAESRLGEGSQFYVSLPL